MIPLSFIQTFFNKPEFFLPNELSHLQPDFFLQFDLIIIKIIHIYYNSIINFHSNFFTNFIKNSSQFKYFDSPHSYIAAFFNKQINLIDSFFRKEIRIIKSRIIKLPPNTNPHFLQNKYKTIYFIINQKKKKIFKLKHDFILYQKNIFLQHNLIFIKLFFFKLFYNQNIVNAIYRAHLNFFLSLFKQHNDPYHAFHLFKNIVTLKWMKP